MSNLIKNRSELVFLYDVKYANPNGDPLDANRPRMDEETGHCLVTDVRLKRTIRDYLMDKGYDGSTPEKDIFVRDENGKSVTGEKRSKSYNDKSDFVKKFIDVRLFGGVSAPKDKKKVFNLTGPVQFGMGKTLHPVRENFIKGTGAFTTDEKAIQKTFREEYNITYGLIGFHGIINENAAKHTELTNEDVDQLMAGIWMGTKDLITRSKKGHMPRFLLKINYKDGFFIGDLIERIKLTPNNGKEPKLVEDCQDYTLDVSELNKVLKKYADKIDSVQLKMDDRIVLSEEISNAVELEIN